METGPIGKAKWKSAKPSSASIKGLLGDNRYYTEPVLSSHKETKVGEVRDETLQR